MILTAIQSYFSAQIQAHATLGLLSDPIEYSLLSDEKALTATLKQRMAASGVVFVIDPPSAESGGTASIGASLLNCVVMVKVAESPVVAHSPAGTALVAAVIGAITARSARGAEQISCAGFDAEIDENGYVLHVIDFRVASVVP
jgi:hypothetical protein